jgi:glycosyltransferase involved in cell wall biosynthesis
MNHKPKLIRITTVPISLDKLLHNQLKFMQQYYDVTAISSDEAELKRIAQSQGVAYKAIEMSRKITPFKDLISLIKLIVFLYQTKPIIVHTHTPKAGIIGMLAAKIVGVPHRLHTVAGLPLMEATGVKRKVLNFVEKLTYTCATNVYPNSNGLNDFIQEQHFTIPNKLKVIGNGSSNGIDTTYFDISLFSDDQRQKLKTDLNILLDDFVFIFVGRLVSDKGINELVKAFTEINTLNRKTKLLLVGPLETELDPLNAETLKTIEQNQAIIYVGYQPDVRPYFAISNCLVFPSYREGFPNVVMQAGAMNLPVIASNINGCNEIIIQNVNGLLIDVKNPKAIVDAMKKMLNNDMYNTCVYNSRKMIVERYEQSYIWSQILKEYSKLLGGV